VNITTCVHPSHAIARPLTRRQRDIWTRITAGMSNKEIARDLDLAVGTVKVHVAGLYRRLGVTNRAAAVASGMSLMRDQRTEFIVAPTLFAKNYVVRYEHDPVIKRRYLAARPH
jgi:DNA-binding CsgD family transcriptional regulator